MTTTLFRAILHLYYIRSFRTERLSGEVQGDEREGLRQHSAEQIADLHRGVSRRRGLLEL